MSCILVNVKRAERNTHLHMQSASCSEGNQIGCLTVWNKLYGVQQGFTTFQTGATFAVSYRLAGRGVIKENNLLKFMTI
jgi:hypothetical protein